MSVKFSHQLLKQSALTEPYTRKILLGSIGQFLDQQIFTGTGTSELTGLMNMSLGTATGANLDWNGMTDMLKECTLAGARDADVAVIASPQVRQLLQTRSCGTDVGGFIWSNDMVASRRAYASNEIGTSAMLVGPMSEIVLGLFGDLIVEVNPFGDNKQEFQQGIVGARVILSCDLAVTYGASLIKSTDVS